MSTDNILSDISIFQLTIKGIMIKTKNSLYALFNDNYSDRILLGAVDL